MRCMKKLLTTVVISVGVVLLLVGCSKKKELSACDEKRKEIEDKYGITVLYGEDKVEAEMISKVKLISDEKKLIVLLDEVEEYLSNIPKDFIKELAVYSDMPINIVLVDEKNIGVIFDIEEYWVVNEYDIKSDVARNMIYSVYWNINHAENSPGFLNELSKYNPADLEYGNVDKCSKYILSENNYYDAYFINDDMMISVVDEIQTLFGLLCDEETMRLYDIKVLPKIQAKFEYLCSELDRVFETVDENAYWARYINNKG